MKKIKRYLKQIYRLTVSHKKGEAIVWRDLKKLHSEAGWKHGIYEKEKYIETVFEIGNGNLGIFYHMIYDRNFHCRVKILEDFDDELTTELFILAAHFNNLLNYGIVVINVGNHFIEYHQKKDILVPLLFNDEMHEQLVRHYEASKDIHSAFQRLVIEREAPAIIIADLVNEKNRNKDNVK